LQISIHPKSQHHIPENFSNSPKIIANFEGSKNTMELILAIIIGFLYAMGIFLILRRSLVKLIIGLILVGNGINLLIFLMGGLNRGNPPIIDASSKVLSNPNVDPVPQALVLTAIVISFGLQSFAIVLIKRVYKTLKTDDLDALNTTDTI